MPLSSASFPGFNAPQLDLELDEVTSATAGMSRWLPDAQTFDQVRGLTVSVHGPAQQLDEHWKGRLDSHRAEFAARRTVNAHRDTFSRLRMQAAADAQAAGQSAADPVPLTLATVQSMREAFQRLATEMDSQEAAPSALRDRAAEVAAQATRLFEALKARAHTLAEAPADDEHAPAHGTGAIVVDVDEAIHGLYAAISYLVQVIKGDGARIAHEFSQEAHLLGHAPLDWVRDTGLPHGLDSFALSTGVGAVLLPFSLLAMKAGIEEIQGARAQKGWLARELASCSTRLRAAQRRFKAASAPALVKVKDTQDLQRQADLTLADELNTAGGRVGLFSVTSGGAIFTKVVGEIASKAVTLATHNAAGPVAAAGAMGIAGTFALGPAAALSAFGLGYYMHSASAKKAAAFSAEKTRTLNKFPEGMSAESAGMAHYAAFVAAKLSQHERFYSDYRNWNAGFLAGSGLYTESALTKIAVVAAVGAGAVSLAHPATLGVVVGLGSLAGLIMAPCSVQFLAGHGRQQRYQQYFLIEDREIDRHFLASADLIATGPGQDPLAGLKLRAAFFQQLHGRETLRQDLLSEVAASQGKRFAGQYTYTADTEATVQARGPKPSRTGLVKAAWGQSLDNTKVRIRAAGQGTGALLHARVQGGASIMRDHWNRERTTLSRHQLRAWLALNCDGCDALIKDSLDLQIAFTEHKLALKLRAYAGLKYDMTTASPGAAEPPSPLQARQMKAMVAELDEDLSRDQQWHQVLCNTRLDCDSPMSEQTRIDLTHRFIALQHANFPTDTPAPATLAEAQAALVEYLMDAAPQRYRDLRGVVLETELEATRLRARFNALQ